nr:ankyrin repeat-containing protein [Tanacetum cinerariifolium]
LHEQFFSISQNGTAQDYDTVFEKMAAQLPGLHEEVQEGIFIKGLKPDLRVAVRTQKPAGVRKAMELALLIDEAGKGGASKPPNEVSGGVPRTSTGATGAEIGKTM